MDGDQALGEFTSEGSRGLGARLAPAVFQKLAHDALPK